VVSEPWLSPDEIAEAVSYWTAVDFDDLVALERSHWHVSRARRLLWACLRSNGMSWPSISDYTGRRHHSTAWKALRDNPPEAEEVEQVMALARQRQAVTS